MIHAKIDDECFIGMVAKVPVIAFQKLEYGYAVASSSAAYYAPLDHPGGGNLPETFLENLGFAFISRMSQPALRTLRPTARPVPTEALLKYLDGTFGPSPEVRSKFDKAPGDRPEVIESECQVVIQAIEEYGRSDLREAMKPAKLDMMSDALDLVIEHAEAARELCEVGDEKPALVKMHVLQATQALKSTLEMFLKP